MSLLCCLACYQESLLLENPPIFLENSAVEFLCGLEFGTVSLPPVQLFFAMTTINEFQVETASNDDDGKWGETPP